MNCKFWGVDSPATVAVPSKGEYRRTLLKFIKDGTMYELQRHPNLFLFSDIYAWHDQYLLLEYSKIDISDINCLFIDSMRIFNYYKSKFNKG